MIEFIIKYRSLTGLFCLIGLWVVAAPNALSIAMGFGIMMLGVVFRSWSAGFINKNRALAQGGPYSLTRNPLYFGNFLLGAGMAVSGNNPPSYIIFGIYYLFFYIILIRVERKRMQQRFGGEYDEWAKVTNLFLPKLKRPDDTGFDIELYIQNREYRVLFFSFLVLLAFILKYLFLIRFI